MIHNHISLILTTKVIDVRLTVYSVRRVSTLLQGEHIDKLESKNTALKLCCHYLYFFTVMWSWGIWHRQTLPYLNCYEL